MKLHSITITASANADPETPLIFVWRDGMDLADLEVAITVLSSYVQRRKDTLATATASQPPMPDPL